MSRQRPRESVFAGGPDVFRTEHPVVCSPNLFECVEALDDVCAEAHDAQQLLRDGTFDLPRMAHILSSQRLFLLVNESTVRKYKADLIEEVEPQIFELIDRAKKGLKVLERREQALKSKVEQAPPSRAVPRASKYEEIRIQMLTSQRQCLEQEFATLQADVTALEEAVDAAT